VPLTGVKHIHACASAAITATAVTVRKLPPLPQHFLWSLLIAPYSERTRLLVSLMLHRLCVPAPPATAAAAPPLALTAASHASAVEAAEAAVVQAQAELAAAEAVAASTAAEAASTAAELAAARAEVARLDAAAAAGGGSDADDHDDPFSPALQAALRESSATAAAAARTAVAAAAAAAAEPKPATATTAAATTAGTNSSAGASSSSEEHQQQDAADDHPDDDEPALTVALPVAVGVVDAYSMMEAAAHVLGCAVARGAEAGALQALALTARLWGGGVSDSGIAARGYAISRGVGAFVCALLLREAEWLQRQEVSMSILLLYTNTLMHTLVLFMSLRSALVAMQAQCCPSPSSSARARVLRL
jgi:hypothetical protein